MCRFALWWIFKMLVFVFYYIVYILILVYDSIIWFVLHIQIVPRNYWKRIYLYVKLCMMNRIGFLESWRPDCGNMNIQKLLLQTRYDLIYKWFYLTWNVIIYFYVVNVTVVLVSSCAGSSAISQWTGCFRSSRPTSTCNKSKFFFSSHIFQFFRGFGEI